MLGDRLGNCKRWSETAEKHPLSGSMNGFEEVAKDESGIAPKVHFGRG
jgi:hypothetical protein